MNGNIKDFTTEEMLALSKNSDNIIVDARQVDAYNGWKLQNEKRGGHIQGAKSLPVKWTKYSTGLKLFDQRELSHQSKL